MNLIGQLSIAQRWHYVHLERLPETLVIYGKRLPGNFPPGRRLSGIELAGKALCGTRRSGQRREDAVAHALRLQRMNRLYSVLCVIDARLFLMVTYVIKKAVHDWNDERAAVIMRNCRKAMQPNGKVLLAETLVPSGEEPDRIKSIDVVMLAVTGRLERT
ncbi:methyltransferase [Nordella sp. HKS 07]|uniref:methyltransferase n=1 Tax=Nordella sp. HKS 07 TaxID=2712222 RepID=UPI001FEDB60B|nr:methyltransferase [Nordella sp. HKS 07]